MDYVDEARKFIQRAADAQNTDVIRENLKIADWCLGQVLGERDARTTAAPPKSP